MISGKSKDISEFVSSFSIEIKCMQNDYSKPDKSNDFLGHPVEQWQSFKNNSFWQEGRV